MGFVILGHILGDFYTQTGIVADKKKESIWYMLLHCFLYFIGMYIIVAVFTGTIIQGLKIAAIIGLAHTCVDILKEKIYFIKSKVEYAVFLLDQTIHIGSLILICYFYKSQLTIATYLPSQIGGISFQKQITILIAFLVCWKPAAIFVSLVFKIIPQTIEDANKEDAESDKDKDVRNKDEIIKIGAWIGILEREIILLLGLLGQYGAIGFVLTAKSVARYRQLENKAFAEKYLVGTLLSSFIAIFCVAICLY